MSPRRWRVTAAGAAALAYLATGVTIVSQDEVGVVRRFGAARAGVLPPGLHWSLPLGIDKVDRVARDRARTVAVGARGVQLAPLSRSPDPASDDFLTGDLNLATAEARVVFRVVDPAGYLFASRSADLALSDLAASALTRALAARGIDGVLTTGRAEVAEQVRRDVQSGSDALGLGVSVRAVRLGRVAPPAPVSEAFADADRARGDKRQAVTRAEEYADRARSDARGRARETLDAAEGRRATVVQAARGDAARFGRVLDAVRGNPGPARRRLYLDALAELLPRFARKVVVAPGQAVDLSLFFDDAGPPGGVTP